MIESVRDLDYLIAEKLFGLDVDRQTGTYSSHERDYSARQFVPSYSRESVAAREVISKMRDRGYYVMPTSKTVGPVTMYEARVFDRDGTEIAISPSIETEATAICLAAAKVLGLEWLDQKPAGPKGDG